MAIVEALQAAAAAVVLDKLLLTLLKSMEVLFLTIVAKCSTLND
jgi:hypothetical protein